MPRAGETGDRHQRGQAQQPLPLKCCVQLLERANRLSLMDNSDRRLEGHIEFPRQPHQHVIPHTFLLGDQFLRRISTIEQKIIAGELADLGPESWHHILAALHRRIDEASQSHSGRIDHLVLRRPLRGHRLGDAKYR